MRAPVGWRALLWADQTALKRRCLAIIDGLPEHDAEHHKEELDRRLAEIQELVREVKFTRGASPEGLHNLLRTQLEVGNKWITPRLFAWAIPDWRLKPAAIPVVSALLGAAVMLALLTTPRALPLALLLVLLGSGVLAVGVVAFSAWVRWRSPHLLEAMRLDRQLETLLELGPADAAAAKYDELRATSRKYAGEPVVVTISLKAARHVAQSEMFSKDRDILRKVVDDATAVVRAPRAGRVHLYEASEVLRAAGPALVPIDRDTAFAVAGILEELAARPGFHGWGCRATAREIRRELGEPWVE